MSFVTWLQKPYPVIETIFHKLSLAVAFGLFIYLFLSIFQPFGIREIAEKQSFYILGFGLVTLLFMSLNYIFFPILSPNWFHKESWTVGRELLFVSFNVLCIAFGNYCYHLLSVDKSIYVFELSSFLFMTITVGIFPIAFLIFTTELALSRKLIQDAQKINTQRHKELSLTTSTSIEKIKLKGELSNDHLELELQQLLYIQSEGNYSNIYYQEANQLQTKLLRISLKNIENQLQEYPSILRCHRSFIVNKNNITHLSGNARSHMLHFLNSDKTIPVSRSFPKEKLI